MQRIAEGLKNQWFQVHHQLKEECHENSQVKLEVLKLYPAQNNKEEETLQMQLRLMTPASATLRPPSTILPTSRSNSALGTLVPREVSTKLNQYHVVPIHNSTVEDGKQNHITGLLYQETRTMMKLTWKWQR